MALVKGTIGLGRQGLRWEGESGRCGWANPANPLYVAYHDEEWGVPEYDSRALWEKLVLDGFQAGLAWITILRKREAFRAAFANFDPEIVAQVRATTDRARLLGRRGDHPIAREDRRGDQWREDIPGHA